MLNKFFKVTVVILGIFLIFTSTNLCPNNGSSKTTPHHLFKHHSDSIRSELVLQTNNYISQNFPKSKLTGEALVAACEKHDFDIVFALAQAEIESGMGTAGKAMKTNSPWNVGAWDSRSAHTMNKLGYGYSHPDQSIEPYIELIKSKYLGDKKTIDDLMKRYVSLSGHRYASNPRYEIHLKNTYSKICDKTTIQQLQKTLNDPLLLHVAH